MATPAEFGSVGHLASRFVGSLVPIGPNAADESWARDHLLEGELELWDRMSPADRRHAVGVARRAVEALGGTVGREVVAAALLHDVGKVESGFGTWSRAGVTFAGMAVGRDKLAGWSVAAATGVRRRVGLYLTHDKLGAEMLAGAGSDPLTVSWAAEHHRPPERWTGDARLFEALKAADDD